MDIRCPSHSSFPWHYFLRHRDGRRCDLEEQLLVLGREGAERARQVAEETGLGWLQANGDRVLPAEDLLVAVGDIQRVPSPVTLFLNAGKSMQKCRTVYYTLVIIGF